MIMELDRANTVISDYLDLAKLDLNTQYTDFNLSQVIEHVIEILRPYAIEFSIQIETAIDKDIWIYGREGFVTQALINLVKNAIEACEDVETGRVVVDLIAIGGMAELAISDSGKGIPKSMLSKLGQPYYSTKTKGTGLGLTFVYKVFHDLGARIRVRTEVGQGTSFNIVFPDVKVMEASEHHQWTMASISSS